MWALLLIIVSGKRDWVVWYQIEVPEGQGYVWTHLGDYEIPYSKLIGWETEGRVTGFLARKLYTMFQWRILCIVPLIC
jgi:hypothetical protein